MRASKLGLLLLILGFGAILETAWGVRGGLSIGPEGCRILTGRFVGPSFAFESEQLRGELPAELDLEVDNAFGSVRVAVGEAGRARLRVRKVVFLPSEAKARAFAEKVLVSAELDGTTLRVATNRRELERDAETARVGVETHLELLVPPATRVRVKNDHGRVEVSEAREAFVESSYDSVRVQKISGAAEIDSRHGDVLVAEIGGPLKVTARHGDVEVGDVAGDTSLDVEYGDLRVARVARLNAKASQGDVAVEDVRGTLDVAAAHAQVSAARIQGGASIVTSYRDVRVSSAQADVHVETEHGEIDAQDVAGRLTVRSSSGQLVARRIGGLLEVTLSRGGVHAEALRQGALIRSSRDDVSLEDFAGPVEIRSRRGDIELRPLGPLASPITASTSSGQIQLVVPPAGRFELDARAPKGEVEVELPDFVVLSSGPHRVEGRRGEAGAALALSAERGSVRVAAAATPERQP